MIEFSRCRKILTFLAHPDDETLAAGATLSKLCRMGVTVHVAIPATGVYGRKNRLDQAAMERELVRLETDCEQALGILGVQPEHIHLGEFSDNQMDSHPRLEVIHWLETLLDAIKPDLIFTHHRYCTNIDHQICHEAVVVATRPQVGLHIPVLCGEVPSSTGYLKPTQWEPNLFVEVSLDDVNAKIRAMETYSGEARPDPHPRSPEVIAALAKVRGSESGFLFAEAFMIQKAFG